MAVNNVTRCSTPTLGSSSSNQSCSCCRDPSYIAALTFTVLNLVRAVLTLGLLGYALHALLQERDEYSTGPPENMEHLGEIRKAFPYAVTGPIFAFWNVCFSGFLLWGVITKGKWKLVVWVLVMTAFVICMIINPASLFANDLDASFWINRVFEVISLWVVVIFICRISQQARARNKSLSDLGLKV